MLKWITNLFGKKMSDWPFTVEVVGTDLVVKDVLATAFGGADDPQDSGQTASGTSTKLHPYLLGCALPMNTPHVSVLRGSPIPHMPFGVDSHGKDRPDGAHVDIEFLPDGQTLVNIPVIDLGPGRQATKPGAKPHAIDLTVAAAKKRDPK